MAHELHEGEKRTIEVRIRRRRGTGAINLTTPERRILDSARALVTGFDWAAATYTQDGDTGILAAFFDATVAALSAPGTYYLQVRGVIGSDRPTRTVIVRVLETGP